jgi:hypothetical protein
MTVKPWHEVDVGLRDILDAAVEMLKEDGAADPDIAAAVQAKLDALEPIEEGE